MKKTLFPLILILLLLGGFGCSTQTTSDDRQAEINRDEILFEAKKTGLIMNDEEIRLMKQIVQVESVEGTNPQQVNTYLSTPIEGWKSAALADVTGGGSFGLAFTQFTDQQFTLIAKMGNLPELQEGFVYEGWLVKRGDELRIVSTGKAQYVEDQLVNIFVASTDLSPYDFYVLTVEPDDDNPAPDEHILEGMIR